MNAKREILFKAKSIENGSWVEGSYDKDTEYRHYIHTLSHYNSSGISIQIDEDTLCQYTGLKDMNGRKIFESDILRGYEYPFQKNGKDVYWSKVVWFEDSPSFGLQLFKTPTFTSINNITIESCTTYMTEWNEGKWEIIDNEIDNRLNVRYCDSEIDALIKYAILQLGIENKGIFGQYHKENSPKPSADKYQLVHVGLIDYIEGESIRDFLDKIFWKYSCPDLPEDYKGRNMTSSDIIAVEGNGKVKYFYVNSFGFEHLTGFHHNSTETNLGTRKF